MADIGALKTEDVGEIVIKDNAGDPTDIVVRVCGPSHEKRVAYEKSQSREFLRDFNARGKARVPENPDVLFRQETDRLLALTLDWENVEMNGERLTCTAENARLVYERRDLSIRDQVLAGLRDREVFTKSSAPS
jgi:hypothetical protein